MSTQDSLDTTTSNPKGLLGELLLPNQEESAAATRRFIELLADTWSFPASAKEIAVLLASELISNAIRHAGQPRSATNRLLVYREDELLRIEVHDSSRDLPRQRPTHDLDESGRGLYLVGLLADDDGSYRTPSGKVVWFAVKAWSQPQE